MIDAGLDVMETEWGATHDLNIQNNHFLFYFETCNQCKALSVCPSVHWRLEIGENASKLIELQA